MKKSKLNLILCLLYLTSFLGHEFEAFPLSSQEINVDDFISLTKRQATWYSIIRPRINGLTGKPIPQSSTYPRSQSFRRYSPLRQPVKKVDTQVNVDKHTQRVSEKWRDLLNQLKATSEVFKNPPDFSKFDEHQKSVFIDQIKQSNILNIAEPSTKPIFVDLTNGVSDINDKHEFYKDYYDVWEDRERLNRQDLSDVEVRLSKSYVTVHPRTNSLLNSLGELILQEAYSNNPIYPSHPHYQLYFNTHQSNLDFWKDIKEKLENHEFRALTNESDDLKHPLIQDITDSPEIEVEIEIYSPKDLAYPAVLELLQQHQQDDQRWLEIVAGKKKVRPVKLNPDEDLAFHVPDLGNRLLKKGSRLYEKVKDYHERNERDRLLALGAKKIVELGHVKPCSEDYIWTLCVVEFPFLGQFQPHEPDYQVYWDAFIKDREKQREQEMLEEILLHVIQEEEGKNGEGKVYFDLTLKQGPFDSNSTAYKYYTKGWQLQQDQKQLNAEKCRTDLSCNDIEAKDLGNGKFSFFDHSKNDLVIGPNDPANDDYVKALEKKKTREALLEDPESAFFGSYLEDVELIPNPGRYPSFKKGWETYHPDHPLWDYLRNEYLNLQRLKREFQIKEEQRFAPKLYSQN